MKDFSRFFEEQDSGEGFSFFRNNKEPKEAGQEEDPSPAAPGPLPDLPSPAKADADPVKGPADQLSDLKVRVHRQLLTRLNLSSLDTLDRNQVSGEIRRAVEELAREEAFLNREEIEALSSQILDEIFGFGPLEPLLKDESVSDILINTATEVWVERSGKLERSPVRFKDESHLRQIIDKIVSGVGRRVDEASPIADARLPDGSRVNVVIPPIAIDGSMLSIRKFKRDKLGPEALIGYGSLTSEMLMLLDAAVKVRLNILISGGTGSGKTTLLNLMSSYIQPNHSIITIEDAAELQLQQPFVRRLETRPPNTEGKGEITQRHLVIAALRMRPDRIILGELRGGEAVDFLQAANTGHDGSMATLHANTPRDGLSRLETMVSMSGLDLPDKAARQQIASAIHLIVQANRLSDGTRKITEIAEIVGMEGDIITTQTLFEFKRTGTDPQTGKVIGHFRATGIRPTFDSKLRAHGIELPAQIFRETGEYE